MRILFTGLNLFFNRPLDPLADNLQQTQTALIVMTLLSFILLTALVIVLLNDRKKSQLDKTLKNYKERWEYALEGNQDGVWDWDRKTNRVIYSSRYKEILGYSDDEMTDRMEEWESRIHPEDVEYVMREHCRYFKGELEMMVIEYRMRKKDNSYCWIIERGKVVEWDPDGVPLRMVGTHTDITHYKQMVQIIEDNTARYEALFNAMTEGFAILQLLRDDRKTPIDFIFMNVNPAFSRIMGVSINDLTGKQASKVFGSRSVPFLDDLIGAANLESIKKLHTYFEPAERTLDVTFTFLGKDILSMIAADTTDQVKTADALAKERNLLRTLVDHLPDAIYVKDLESRKTFANQADVNLMKANSETEALGKTDYHFYPKELAEQLVMDDRQVIETGVPLRRQEVIYTDIEDSRRNYSTLKLPLYDADGKITGIVGIGRDISEQIAAEEKINRAKDELSCAYDSTLEGWSRALELRESETGGHSQRVVNLTLRLARALDVDENDLVHIRRGALLHDIGKMGVPDNILLKPGPLTQDEWVIMRQHPNYAYELLKPIQYLRPALEIPYCHHEKWNGTGYPRGLQGVNIPIAARIFTVVDVWDALLSTRTYRPAWPEDEVRSFMRAQVGKSFDPEVVIKFLDVVVGPVKIKA